MPNQIWVIWFVYQTYSKLVFKADFRYKITFWNCACVLWIHKDYFVVKQMVWNVPHKGDLRPFHDEHGRWWTKCCYPILDGKMIVLTFKCWYYRFLITNSIIFHLIWSGRKGNPIYQMGKDLINLLRFSRTFRGLLSLIVLSLLLWLDPLYILSSHL